MPSKTPVKSYLGLTSGQVGDYGSYVEEPGQGEPDEAALSRAKMRVSQLAELYPLKRGYQWIADFKNGLGLAVLVSPDGSRIPFETENSPREWLKLPIIRREGFDLLMPNSTETLTEPYYATDKETGNTYRVPPGTPGGAPWQAPKAGETPWELTSTPRGTGPQPSENPIGGGMQTPFESPGWERQLDKEGRPVMFNKLTGAALKGTAPESPWGEPKEKRPRRVQTRKDAQGNVFAVDQELQDDGQWKDLQTQQTGWPAAKERKTTWLTVGDTLQLTDDETGEVIKTIPKTATAAEKRQAEQDAWERDQVVKGEQETARSRFQRAQEFAGSQTQAQQELRAKIEAENARLNFDKSEAEQKAWMDRQLLYANPRLPAAAYESIRSGRTPFVNQPFKQVDRGPDYQAPPMTTLTTPFQQMRAAGLNVQGAEQAYVDVPGVGKVFAGAPDYEQWAQKPGAQVTVPQLTPQQTQMLSLPSWGQFQQMSPDEVTYREAQLSGMGFPTQQGGSSTGWLGGQVQATQEYWGAQSPYGAPGTAKFAGMQAAELDRQNAIAAQRSTPANPFSPRPRVSRRF